MRSFYVIFGKGNPSRFDHDDFVIAFEAWRIVGGRLYGVGASDESVLLGERDR